MTDKKTCACGHDKSYHIVGIGGCTHDSRKDGNKRTSIITNVEDWDCDCNKFEGKKLTKELVKK